ncbi:MAG: FHA domain-containing protein [Thermodesulfobacteriota bacterium]
MDETQISGRLISRPSDVKITKVVKDTLRSKPTKIKSDPAMSQTRIAPSAQAAPTKIFGQPKESKEVFGWLVVIKGSRQWEQFIIPREDRRYILGSSSDSDFKFDHDGIEPVHASLRMEGDKVYLTDLDTSSGTFVKGEKIIRTEIEDGSQFKIGSMELKFKKL